MEQKLILIRGLPGSSKTTLAMKMHKETGIIPISTDDFFNKNGEYKWNYKFLKAAHQWCFGMTAFELFCGRSVVVHNTFIEKWSMEMYIDFAHSIGVEWEILEPNTKWKFNVEECAKRNTHGVSESAVQKMMDRWEKTKDILEQFEKYKV